MKTGPATPSPTALVLCLAALAALAGVACGGEGQGERTRETCTPGETKTCSCPDGSTSSKVCGEQGDSTFPASASCSRTSAPTRSAT